MSELPPYDVPFAGEESDGPATWGQQAFWDGLLRYDCTGWNRNVATVVRLPEGSSLNDTLNLLGRITDRHEGLRTEVYQGADGLRQRVHAQGTLSVGEISGAHPADTAREAARLRALPLGTDGVPPFAASVAVEDGRPRALVLAFSHLVVDASSVRVILDGLARPSWEPAAQPREQALREAGELRRTGLRAAGTWVREAGDTVFPFAAAHASPAEGRVVQQVLTSAPAAERLLQISAALGADASAVLLTVAAVGLAVPLGLSRLPLQVVTSNRHRTGTRNYVGVLAQFGPLTVGLDPDASFTDVLARTGRRAMSAYNSALWSPAGLQEALAAAGRSLDDVLGATLTFNDIRAATFPPVLDHPAEPDPGRDHCVHDLPRWPYQGGRCAIAVVGGKDVLQFALRADTRYVAPRLAAALLPGIDAVLRRVHEKGGSVRIGELGEAA
ncbi:hypothetical protein ADK41_30975 [Streptomyces caelestis]|uniref:Condensation domain-containing protein n=2 Tax=Streptomyces TaxID=1883 RepID=A0A0M8QH41_9ACTN|nr:MULTISPECIES: hypothetical protein [Streptomyces]AGZ93796.1 non-ribosomal peptide synthetase [Streptomyces sp. XY152]KOT31429.1 hypothetical protein ADK41_30975 [Streptomyces caelestis]KOV22198.1 hypothetical protein ADK58_28275 [Streptomyces sp. XY152]